MPTQHAILILAHDNPAGLSRLVARLTHPKLHIFIHVDRKSTRQFNTAVLEQLGAQVISTRRVNWGGFSSCLAQLDLLRLAMANGPFRTYSLISGRDYPVQRIELLAHSLDTVQHSRINHWSDKDPTWYRRYTRMYFYDFPVTRILNAVSRRLAPVLPDRQPPQGIEIYFGWAWWTLTHPGVEAVFRFCHERPDVLSWYRFVHIADESFFQTALKNVSSPPPLDQHIHRYIQFPNASAHPKAIDYEDLTEALSGSYWFARKIDEDACAGVANAIDDALGYQPTK